MTPRRDPTTTAEYRRTEPEAAFQTWVLAYARLHGWLVAHINDSRGQDADGLPDLVLARNGVVLLVELKSARGEVEPGQAAWLAASAAQGYVWRPGMRLTVMAVLT